MRQILLGLTLFLSFLLFFQLTSCKKNQFITSAGAGLSFEVDTLTFDTVFTGLGNATRRFKVYNPHPQPILLNNVRLAGGQYSDYKINIDGFTGHTSSNIEIPPKDSIYIFAKVYIDPNNGDAIREDSILFETDGGGSQRVVLHAYGWNANYIGQVGYQTTFFSDTTLTPGRPYIFMGIVRFVNACLTIQGGTQIYMFGGPSTQPGGRAAILIDSNACIKSNVGGDLNNPVELKTHRLEADYQNITFHHQGIILATYSRDNQIHGTIIRNAVDGIQVQARSINSSPKLEIRKSFIYNVDRAGIIGLNADIDAYNTIIANSNQYNFVGIYGGEYDFTHCTFANLGSALVSRSEPIISARDYLVEDDIVFQNDTTNHTIFTNCIIYGTKREEVEFLLADNNPLYDFELNHTLVKADTFSQGIGPNCIRNQDPLFVDEDEFIFEIDSSGSPAKDAGRSTSTFTDALGRIRNTSSPTLGAYEWQ